MHLVCICVDSIHLHQILIVTITINSEKPEENANQSLFRFNYQKVAYRFFKRHS